MKFKDLPFENRKEIEGEPFYVIECCDSYNEVLMNKEVEPVIFEDGKTHIATSIISKHHKQAKTFYTIKAPEIQTTD